MTMMSRLLVGVFLLAFLSAGCGHTVSRPKIQGTVTFQGKPLEGQTLALTWDGPSDEFFAYKLVIGTGGTFSGVAPQPGRYKVAIEVSLAAQEGVKPAPGTQVNLPRNFRDPATSNLTWEVKEGDNKRDFELQP